MNLVRAELAKITSTRLWWALLIGAAVWTAFYAAIFAAMAGLEPGPGEPASPGLEDPSAIRQVYATAALLGPQIFALVVGVIGMTGEYRYQTITPTLLAAPRRSALVMAKMGAHALIGAVFGLVGVLTALVVGGTVITVRGGDLGLGTEGLIPAALGAILPVALWTLMGVGLGTLIRNQVAAVLVAVVFAFLVEQLIGLAVSLVDALEGLAKFLPTNAATALTNPPPGFTDYLPAWGGGLVLLGYAAAFAVLGVLLTTRRDVT